MANKQKKMTLWEERDFVRNRFQTFMGQADFAKTVAAKELIDNAIDQLADGLTSKAYFEISNNSMLAMDSGKGISFDILEGTDKTELSLAVYKLYSSTNYEGTEGLAGTNGVGATCNNFLSKNFLAGHIKDNQFKGYKFKDGLHDNDCETIDIIDDFEAPMEKGFYVKAEYDENIIKFNLNKDWLKDYIEERTGELPDGCEVFVKIYGENEESNKFVKFDKIKNSENYVKSWEEKVLEVADSVILTNKNSSFKVAFSRTQKAFDNVKSIVQGAPVKSSTSYRAKFIMEDNPIYTNIPYTFYYKGKKSPDYTDQTKIKIGGVTSEFITSFLSQDKDLYNFYFDIAKENYFKSMLKDNVNEMYWPATEKEDLELIIGEGYSAISGVKAKRNSKKQACLALKGKILNVMQKDLNAALKSVEIRELISVINNNDFKRIIVAVDADGHGSHIFVLLLAIFHKFAPRYLKENRVYYCNTPLYVFTNTKTKEIQWSDYIEDCPKGYKVGVKKGLGSLTQREIQTFIIKEETRDIWQIEYDMPLAEEKLKFALMTGGEDWIINDPSMIECCI